MTRPAELPASSPTDERAPQTAADVLTAAADWIESADRFIPDYTARGIYPATPSKVAEKVPTACLATAPFAERWNAAGSIWRHLNICPRETVLRAYSFFAALVGRHSSIYVWCCNHSHAEQITALRTAASQAEAA